MSQVGMFFREKFAKRSLPREPEPDLVMDDPQAVAAFSAAGRPDGPAAAYYLFYTARASQVIAGAKRVLDVGTGPGTQLVQLAGLHPSTRFVGLDLSDSMLGEARRHASSLGIGNIEFAKGDVTKLQFQDGSFDGVTGIMALHHLPSAEHLRRAFSEIRRVLVPGGALFIVDFGRLKSLHSMISLAYEKVDQQHILLTRDYERSLRAAFRYEDYVNLAKEYFPQASVNATYQVPLLVIVKSEDRPLPPPTLERLREAADRLDAPRRRDLDEIRVYLALGGLGSDPFEGGVDFPWAHRRIVNQGMETEQSSLNFGSFRRTLAAFRLGAELVLHRAREGFWVWLGESVRRREAGSRKRDAEHLGRTLRKNLGALKGPLMKFGQMASYVDDRVPEEIRKMLSSLQDRSSSLPSKVIRDRVERALGRPLKELFSDWEDRPLAAASVSQLHMARLKTGENVVVKVLYPGIANAIKTDLGLVGMLAPWIGRKLRVSNVRELMDEAGKKILAECDLAGEAAFQNLFGKAFADDPRVLVPRVHKNHSNAEVLTMDYIEGRSFSHFVEEATPSEKSAAGETIAGVTVTSLHKFCLFNGDPHPGNYLFLKDGRVAFLDFGFSQVWDKEFINSTKTQALAAMERDLGAFTAACRSIGYESSDPEKYRHFMDLLREGPYLPWMDNSPFKYTREFVRKELGAISDFYRRHGPVRISPNHLMVHRVFWGHHAIFADLGAEFNLHQVLVPLLRKPL